MNTTNRITVIAVVLSALSGSAQTLEQYRFLQPGESVTYTFDSLPHSGPFGDTVPTPAQGQFYFDPYQIVSLDAVLRFELFEQSTTEAPILVGSWSLGSPQYGATIPDAWQDRQGMVRFTGVSGITGFDSFRVVVLTPVDTFHYDRYDQTFAAVPEPSAMALTIVGLIVGVSIVRRRYGTARPNKPDAADPSMASRFAVVPHGRGFGEPTGRSAS